MKWTLDNSTTEMNVLDWWPATREVAADPGRKSLHPFLIPLTTQWARSGHVVMVGSTIVVVLSLGPMSFDETGVSMSFGVHFTGVHFT
jgi:hypothetical protein